MLRKLREGDLPQVLVIEEATAPVPWTEKIFRDCFFAGYPGWVIEVDKRIICFCFFVVHGDECHLLNLGVHPQYHRQGYGTQMLKHAITCAKQRGSMMIYLEVRESNERAIKLYQKLKFTQIGMRQDYYPAQEGRENALVFAQDLMVFV